MIIHLYSIIILNYKILKKNDGNKHTSLTMSWCFSHITMFTFFMKFPISWEIYQRKERKKEIKKELHLATKYGVKTLLSPRRYISLFLVSKGHREDDIVSSSLAISSPCNKARFPFMCSGNRFSELNSDIPRLETFHARMKSLQFLKEKESIGRWKLLRSYTSISHY